MKLCKKIHFDLFLLLTFITQHATIAWSVIEKQFLATKSSCYSICIVTHLQLHSHGRWQSPFLQPGYGWHLSQFSPWYPTLHLHSPGFLQYPCFWLQFGAQIAIIRRKKTPKTIYFKIKRLKRITNINVIFNLRIWHNIPVQPGWHLHSCEFWIRHYEHLSVSHQSFIQK